LLFWKKTYFKTVTAEVFLWLLSSCNVTSARIDTSYKLCDDGCGQWCQYLSV